MSQQTRALPIFLLWCLQAHSSHGCKMAIVTPGITSRLNKGQTGNLSQKPLADFPSCLIGQNWTIGQSLGQYPAKGMDFHDRLRLINPSLSELRWIWLLEQIRILLEESCGEWLLGWLVVYKVRCVLRICR